ncbi:MAG: ATP-binding protein [Thermodesulfobacteriota bacterium]|nr:ATP-binding protein [Thermodesulfobacteriota bacterium]
MTKINVMNGPIEGRSFDIIHDLTFIGRGTDNDIQIKDPSISRKHVKITRKGDKFFLEDLKSHNGTLYNGRLIKPGHEFRIKEGVPISIGNIIINLGKDDAEEGMVTKHSINIFKGKGESRENLFYKDKRLTNRKNLELIYEVSTSLMHSLDINEISEKIMDSIFSSLKRIDSGSVLLIDEKTGEVNEILSRSRSGKKNIKMNYSRTVVDRVIREGKAIVMSDISREEPGDLSESIKIKRIKSIMCVPLTCKSEIRGVIYVHSINVPQGFRKDDLFLLTGLTGPAAVALENALLYSKRKLAEEALLKAKNLESIGVLAGGIAHDYNNLLTAILGNISLALSFLKPKDEIYNLLIAAQKASMRAKDLTKKLITLSKGEGPVKKVTSIAPLLKYTSEFALSGSNVSCDFSIESSLWSVEIDQALIDQVIQSLVINAKEAMPEGGTIKITAKNISLDEDNDFFLKSGKYIKLSFGDHGTGIPEEDLSKVFDPYFSTKEMGSQKGMGLGLSICHSIMKKHDGHISVESKVGQGTTFSLYFPAAEKEIQIKEPVEKMTFSGKKRILVMDDEEMIRDVAGQMLNHLGYEAIFARDGAEAVEKFKKAKESGNPFHSVILDLTVRGGMGGREAMKKLLRIDPHIKGIVSSGYTDDFVMTDFKKYSFKGAIAKPYQFDELSEVLNRVVNIKE